MKWFEVTAYGRTTAGNTIYCVQACDDADAIDWVIEEARDGNINLGISELHTKDEIEASQSKADIIFWGD